MGAALAMLVPYTKERMHHHRANGGRREESQVPDVRRLTDSKRQELSSNTWPLSPDP